MDLGKATILDSLETNIARNLQLTMLIIDAHSLHSQPSNTSAPRRETDGNDNRPVFLNLMDSIITQNQRETGDSPADTFRKMAVGALDTYLYMPISKNHEGTYSFWRRHSMTIDVAQRGLCNLARTYLTPPPTSTGMWMLNFHLFLQLTLSSEK